MLVPSLARSLWLVLTTYLTMLQRREGKKEEGREGGRNLELEAPANTQNPRPRQKGPPADGGHNPQEISWGRWTTPSDHSPQFFSGGPSMSPRLCEWFMKPILSLSSASGSSWLSAVSRTRAESGSRMTVQLRDCLLYAWNKKLLLALQNPGSSNPRASCANPRCPPSLDPLQIDPHTLAAVIKHF